jgi:peroxiredoxin
LAAIVLLVVVGCGAPDQALLPRSAPAGAVSAPDFTLTLLDGSTLKASALWAKRPAVLVFLSSWCTTCAERDGEIAKLARDYGDGVAFVGVAAADEVEALRTYVDKHDIEYAVGIDPAQTIWRKYAVREPPAVAIVARGGKLVRGWPGGLEADELDAQVRRWLITTT